MISLLLARDDRQRRRTHGRLYVDGKFQAYTLEDTVREHGVKVQGETAIPPGCYRVVLQDSGRFGPDCLTLLDVPNFTYIRIHAGNSEKDTEGCLLVGAVRGVSGIERSRVALAALRAKLVPALKAGNDAWIQVVNVPAGERLGLGA